MKPWNYKHNEKDTRLYRIWAHMRGRCNNPRDKAYSNYGGRGISITKDWEEFLDFKKWAINSGYSDDLTIDRINNDGNYCPENCRWANCTEQANNRRSNRNITLDGITMNEAAWADFLQIPRYVLRTRLHRGMSEEDAIKTPVRTNEGGHYVTKNYYELAKARLDAVQAQMDIFDLMKEE